MKTNNKDIIQYLNYLKEVSRKISLNTGLEKVLLPNKRKTLIKNRFSIQIKQDLTKNILKLKSSEFENWIIYLDKNVDKKPFLGFGLICGIYNKNSNKKAFAGPLIIVECNMYNDENNVIICEIDLSKMILNYDLISNLIEKDYNTSSEESILELEKESKIIEQIERDIEKIEDILETQSLAQNIFRKLQENFEEFKDIEIYNYDYDYEEEKEKFKKGNSLFDREGLVFVNANHLFIESVPNELSSYESLSKLIKEIESTGTFENETLKKLLNNIFSGYYNSDFNEKSYDVLKSYLDFLPISLSEKQKEALLSAFSSEISYIQGPPGTGKSHTIIALILLSIILNKKILVVSQKVPALEVIDEKIRPFLKFDENLPSVIYYSKDIKKELKESLKLLIRKSLYEISLENKTEEIKLELLEIEDELEKQINNVKEDENKLSEDIERERKIYKLTEELKNLLANFEYKYFKVNKIEKYIEEKKVKILESCINKLKLIEENRINNAITLRFRIKILEFTLKEIPGILRKDKIINLLREHMIHRLLSDLKNIVEKVNQILYEEKKIIINRDYIRKDIEHYRREIKNLSKKYIILKKQYNILSKLLQESYITELQKFNNLLRFTSAKKINEFQNNIDWEKITDVYPVWISEIRNINEILPMKANMFDIVVVDEASQVNLAEIIPVFYRGKNICIVGDHKQLSLISTGLTFQLSKNLDRLIWEKYKPGNMSYSEAQKRNLTVTTSSILDYIRTEENGFSIREIMLDEHFRSLPMLARFTNEKFYNNKLKIMTETPDKASLNPFYPVKIDGKRIKNKKEVIEEAEEVINIVKSITQFRIYKNVNLPYIVPEKFNIGILSFTRNQTELIKNMLFEEIQEDIIKEYEIVVGTPEELQGHERDIMILSLALDEEAKQSRNHYEKQERFNVATSRAKFFTFIVYSSIPKNFHLTISYFKNFGYTPYIEEESLDNIESVDTPKYLGWTFNPLAFESDFENIVYGYLSDYIEKKKKTGIEIHIFNQVKACGQKRLDFVLYNPKNKRFVSLEVDGIHHFDQDGRTYSELHKERIETLKRAGWNIINTPYYKWYRGGWLDEDSKDFKEELERIYKELDKYLLV